MSPQWLRENFTFGFEAHEQHRQCSEALTSPVLKRVSVAVHQVKASHLPLLFSPEQRKQLPAHIDVWLNFYCDI